MKMVVSTQYDPIDLLEGILTDLPLGFQRSKALLPLDQQHRTTDGRHQCPGLPFAHSKGRKIPQTGIAAPVPAPCPLFKLPLTDQTRGLRRDIRHFATGGYGFIDGGKTVGTTLPGATAV